MVIFDAMIFLWDFVKLTVQIIHMPKIVKINKNYIIKH